MIDINAILKTAFRDLTNPQTNHPVHELTSPQLDGSVTILSRSAFASLSRLRTSQCYAITHMPSSPAMNPD